MEAYSREMRRDVLAACDAGEERKPALPVGCSESWVRQVKQERREQGKMPLHDSTANAQVGALARTKSRSTSPSARHDVARTQGCVGHQVERRRCVRHAGS